jgi:hypothetical protein
VFDEQGVFAFTLTDGGGGAKVGQTVAWQGCKLTLKTSWIYEKIESYDVIEVGDLADFQEGSAGAKKHWMNSADEFYWIVPTVRGGSQKVGARILWDKRGVEQHTRADVFLTVKDKALAERIAKAWNHAITLCQPPKEPEPF